MVHDGNKRSSADGSYINPEPSHQNLTLPRTQAVQRSEAGKNLRDMEERRYSDLYRNTTEELFIKTFMEGSAAPTMDMLGFKNLTQNFRADSEELFNSWLTNGENQVNNSASIAHRTRQASRRITSELAPLPNQHNSVILQKQSNENPTSEHACIAEESSNDFNQYPASSAVERGVPTGNLYLAKAWFNSSQPMTRSRSSELRKRYVASQNTQTAFGMEAMHNINASGHGISNFQQDFTNSDGLLSKVPLSDNPSQLNTFMSPSNSSSSNFNSPHMGTVDNVSSVVSMLKGTLERKWLHNQNEKYGEDSSLGYYGAQGIIANSSLDQEQELHNYEAQGTFQDSTTIQVLDPEVLKRVQGLLDMESEETVAPTNPVHMNTVSREQSQSESSAATPAVSVGFDPYDGPSNSGQARSNGESSRQQVGNEKNSINGIRAKDIRERIHDNLKEDCQQKGGLVRYGSVTSAGSADKGDPTKKRRVERSRKMAEAKERVLTPAIPSDMQSVLKRCENLEKEARSLKLNLSFMNRKDSEQTKHIEELQKQNEELTDEKERLLEEIERIISETSKM